MPLFCFLHRTTAQKSFYTEIKYQDKGIIIMVLSPILFKRCSSMVTVPQPILLPHLPIHSKVFFPLGASTLSIASVIVIFLHFALYPLAYSCTVVADGRFAQGCNTTVFNNNVSAVCIVSTAYSCGIPIACNVQ